MINETGCQCWDNFDLWSENKAMYALLIYKLKQAKHAKDEILNNWTKAILSLL